MSPSLAIEIVCKALDLDKSILTCPNNCKQNDSYSEGRMIVTYILRNQKQYPKYKEIAFSLGRILKDGTGDHAICIYYKKIADQLISIGHIEFKGKIEKVLIASKCEKTEKSLCLDQCQ